jgi:hypothetical protein
VHLCCTISHWHLNLQLIAKEVNKALEHAVELIIGSAFNSFLVFLKRLPKLYAPPCTVHPLTIRVQLLRWTLREPVLDCGYHHFSNLFRLCCSLDLSFVRCSDISLSKETLLDNQSLMVKRMAAVGKSTCKAAKDYYLCL